MREFPCVNYTAEVSLFVYNFLCITFDEIIAKEIANALKQHIFLTYLYVVSEYKTFYQTTSFCVDCVLVQLIS